MVLNDWDLSAMNWAQREACKYLPADATWEDIMSEAAQIQHAQDEADSYAYAEYMERVEEAKKKQAAGCGDCEHCNLIDACCDIVWTQKGDEPW